jgi:threonine synthase
MSCAGAAYGLSIVLFVPETAPVNKLMQSVLYESRGDPGERDVR